MIHIVGEGVIPQAQAFADVRDALEFDMDVYLGAMWAPLIGLKLKAAVIYNMEPLYDESQLFSVANYMETLKDNIIIDFSMTNVEYLKQLGIEAFHMPYGYHQSLERTCAAEKDIDVLFVGSEYYPRRRELFDKLSEKCHFVSVSGVYGKELDNLISRAKVHLNLHHHQAGQTLETVRLNYLMANHGNIVSEPGNDVDVNERYAPGIRFAKYEDLISTCLNAIENPMDGHKTIISMKQECHNANRWASCQQFM